MIVLIAEARPIVWIVAALFLAAIIIIGAVVLYHRDLDK